MGVIVEIFRLFIERESPGLAGRAVNVANFRILPWRTIPIPCRLTVPTRALEGSRCGATGCAEDTRSTSCHPLREVSCRWFFGVRTLHHHITRGNQAPDTSIAGITRRHMRLDQQCLNVKNPPLPQRCCLGPQPVEGSNGRNCASARYNVATSCQLRHGTNCCTTVARPAPMVRMQGLDVLSDPLGSRAEFSTFDGVPEPPR